MTIRYAAYGTPHAVAPVKSTPGHQRSTRNSKASCHRASHAPTDLRTHTQPTMDATAAPTGAYITAAPFFAERAPAIIAMTLGLVSKRHRDALVVAGRNKNSGLARLPFDAVVGSVSDLLDAWRVHKDLGLTTLEWDGRFRVCVAAARAGNIDVFQCANQRMRCYDMPSYGIDCQESIGKCWKAAIAHGQITMIAWLIEHYPGGCPWRETNGPTLNDNFPHRKIYLGPCAIAAANRQHATLQWLRAPERIGGPCPWNAWTCSYAAAAGHLDMLIWARAQDPPCPWARHIFCISRDTVMRCISGFKILTVRCALAGRENMRICGALWTPRRAALGARAGPSVRLECDCVCTGGT